MMTKKWNEIRSGSKITLEKDTKLYGMNGREVKMNAGHYYIAGFWADLCGINSQRGEYTGNSTAEYFIGNTELKKFKNIV